MIYIYLGISSKSIQNNILSIRGGGLLGNRNSNRDDDENINTSKRSSSSTTASIQYMITNKMRKTLIDELGYLNSEVNEMDPQIAVVLLEKRLPRPMNGMPTSWKRPGGTPGDFFNFQPFTAIFSRVVSILQGITFTVSSSIPNILPFVLSVAAVAILASVLPQTIPVILSGLSQPAKIFNRKETTTATSAYAKDISKNISKKYRKRRVQVMSQSSDLYPAEVKSFLQRPSALAKVRAQAGDVNIRSFECVAERKVTDIFAMIKSRIFRQ